MFPKHSSMFKRLSKFIMKLFPRGLFLVTQALRSQKSFRLSLCEKQYAQTKPGYATVSKSTVKICQGDLPKVTDLKGSPKRAVKSFFHNASYTKASKSKTSTEM